MFASMRGPTDRREARKFQEIATAEGLKIEVLALDVADEAERVAAVAVRAICR